MGANNQRNNMSPLAKELWNIAHPMKTFVAQNSDEELQVLLGEANEEIDHRLTPEEVNHLAAIEEEKISEGRTFPHRPQRHE